MRIELNTKHCPLLNFLVETNLLLEQRRIRLIIRPLAEEQDPEIHPEMQQPRPTACISSTHDGGNHFAAHLKSSEVANNNGLYKSLKTEEFGKEHHDFWVPHSNSIVYFLLEAYKHAS